MLELGYNLPSKTVVNLLEEINFNDERVEAYATTMKVLNRMNNDINILILIVNII